MPGKTPSTRAPARKKTAARKKAPVRKKRAAATKTADRKKAPARTKTPRKTTTTAGAPDDAGAGQTPDAGFVILLDPPPAAAPAPATNEDDGFVILLDGPQPAAPPSQGAADGAYALEADCSVRQLAATHAALCGLLDGDGPLTIDIGAVRVHDSALVQLLCAFERDASARGTTVRYRGDTDAIAATARALGLTRHLSL